MEFLSQDSRAEVIKSVTILSKPRVYTVIVRLDHKYSMFIPDPSYHVV